MSTKWTTKGNRDAVSSCSCDRRLHRYLRKFGGRGVKPECERWLKVRWCGESPSTTTQQILTLTEGWPSRLTRKPRAAGASRPVEVIARDGQFD